MVTKSPDGRVSPNVSFLLPACAVSKYEAWGFCCPTTPTFSCVLRESKCGFHDSFQRYLLSTMSPTQRKKTKKKQKQNKCVPRFCFFFFHLGLIQGTKRVSELHYFAMAY
ncbi:hypothetical protein K449DRAFT_63208 [Hypoxylon sp. EC38]|nr:hypothetical protein K449DRAFT_63208 [Hypoxylon sp. EC38]